MTSFSRIFSHSFEAKVKNGFPILFWYNMMPAEPDVGIMSEYIEDYKISTMNEKPCPWLKVTGDEITKIIQSIYEGM